MRQNTSSAFNDASNLERVALHNLCVNLMKVDSFIPTAHGCHIDAITDHGKLNDGSGIVGWEAKLRRFPSDRYDSAMIEYPKYFELMTLLSKDYCSKVIYAMFHTDNKVWLYNLMNWEPEWKVKQLVKTTAGNNALVDKQIGYIDNETCGVLVDLDQIHI